MHLNERHVWPLLTHRSLRDGGRMGRCPLEVLNFHPSLSKPFRCLFQDLNILKNQTSSLHIYFLFLLWNMKAIMNDNKVFIRRKSKEIPARPAMKNATLRRICCRGLALHDLRLSSPLLSFGKFLLGESVLLPKSPCALRRWGRHEKSSGQQCKESEVWEIPLVGEKGELRVLLFLLFGFVWVELRKKCWRSLRSYVTTMIILHVRGWDQAAWFLHGFGSSEQTRFSKLWG